MASKSAKLLQLINYRESRSLCNFLGDGVLGGPSPGAARTDHPPLLACHHGHPGRLQSSSLPACLLCRNAGHRDGWPPSRGQVSPCGLCPVPA